MTARFERLDDRLGAHRKRSLHGWLVDAGSCGEPTMMMATRQLGGIHGKLNPRTMRPNDKAFGMTAIRRVVLGIEVPPANRLPRSASSVHALQPLDLASQRIYECCDRGNGSLPVLRLGSAGTFSRLETVVAVFESMDSDRRGKTVSLHLL